MANEQTGSNNILAGASAATAASGKAVTGKLAHRVSVRVGDKDVTFVPGQEDLLREQLNYRAFLELKKGGGITGTPQEWGFSEAEVKQAEDQLVQAEREAEKRRLGLK